METPRRLILYFDINGTTIMRDSITMKTEETMITHEICKQAWGRVDVNITVDEEEVEHEEKTWSLGYETLSRERPNEDLTNYHEFVNILYPLQRAEEEAENEKRKEYNKQQKIERREKELAFVSTGNPGTRFRKTFDKLLKCLELPKGGKAQLGITEVNPGQPTVEETDIKRDLPDAEAKENAFRHLFNNGKYHLIPSFFKTLIGLRKAKREFSVIFRTFGDELDDVINEFNRFCEGTHPCFNGKQGSPLVRFDGSKGTRDLRIPPQNTGVFYRNEDLDEMRMVFGSTKRADPGEPLEDFYGGALEEGEVHIITGSMESYMQIMDNLKEKAGFGIRDDYEYWRKNGRNADSGKLHLVDQAEYNVQHIFFDDLITGSEENDIVDVRDLITNEKIPFRKANNKYFVKVETDRAILELDYFLKMIDICETRRSEEIQRIEQGIDSDDQSEGDQFGVDRTKFQFTTSEAYLKATVLPVLFQGLRIIDIERPNNPVAALAHYMIKNKHLVKLPEFHDEREEIEELEGDKDKEKEGNASGLLKASLQTASQHSSQAHL